MYTQTAQAHYSQVQHYQFCAASLLRAKLLKRPLIADFYRQQMAEVKKTLKAR